MGRAIIKNIDNSSSNGAAGSVASPTGGASGGTLMTGTLTDVASKQDFRFEQPLGSEEGIMVGSKVSYNTVTAGGAVVANSVKLLEKGIIQSLNTTDDGGTMLDKGSGATIPFLQNYCNATGLIVGSIVDFETVNDPTLGETAVALVLIK
jgi:hypothetical protein